MSTGKEIPSGNISSLRSSITTSSYLAAMHISLNFPLSLTTLADQISERKHVSLRSIILKLKAKPLALIFSKNSPSNVIEGHEFPDDMPPVHWPVGFEHCSRDKIGKIREAWVLAHYYTWRAHQVMEFIAKNMSRRQQLWDDGYTSNIGSLETGGFNNYAPRAWFGPYDPDRFDMIRGSIEKVWNERFLGKELTFKVICRTDDVKKAHPAHPCYAFDVSANHILFGTINFCDEWFERRSDLRARTTVHEVFHWLKIPGSAWWVTDNHDYYVGPRAVLDYKPVEPLYGNLAVLIANNGGFNDRNYERTARNNDNYAYFIYQLGRGVYRRQTELGDTMIQFPSPNFKW
jgi:hypothetical protein